MNKLMSTVVPPQLKLNVDGTQFCVGSKDNGRIVVKYRERVDGKALKVLPENGDGGLRYSMKYYALKYLGLYVILYSCLRIIVWTGRHQMYMRSSFSV